MEPFCIKNFVLSNPQDYLSDLNKFSVEDTANQTCEEIENRTRVLTGIREFMPNESLIGAEIGVMYAKSFCTFLQQCPKIKKMYGVDSYKPYTDYLKIVYDGTPGFIIDEKASENIKLVAMHNIKWSEYAEKVEFLEMDSTDATNLILDGELDFIFLDAYLTPQQLTYYKLRFE
jgi:hypothetical protein